MSRSLLSTSRRSASSEGSSIGRYCTTWPSRRYARSSRVWPRGSRRRASAAASGIPIAAGLMNLTTARDDRSVASSCGPHGQVGLLHVTGPRSSCRSALHIRQLLGHLAVSHPEDIHSTYVAAIPCVPPRCTTRSPAEKVSSCLEPGVAVGEDRVPGASDRLVADVAHPVRGRPGGVEDAVVGNKCQSGLEVVRRPSQAEVLHDARARPAPLRSPVTSRSCRRRTSQRSRPVRRPRPRRRGRWEGR